MSSPSAANPYISLIEAKEQLSIDEGLTMHDARINRLIGAAIDWAESFTGRSLGELMELSSPSDESAVPLPEPKDSPSFTGPEQEGIGLDVAVDGREHWDERTWQNFWRNNPILRDDSQSLRRDVKEAILMRIELLFDRNTDNWDLLDKTSTDMLFPYRIGMGV